MCGIFGCVGKMQRDDAYKCIRRIAHRGPDALAVKELQGAVLAHARLSILDTSDAANQPMSDVTGRYWIVYNGEVYNFLELRKELELLGYHFRTDSDSEVVLYAYIAWGERFQKKCNGMWAIAIWDDYEKKLFLSRDRFGIKPIYYYMQDGNFYFASEMKAFFPIMKERVPNYELLYLRDVFCYEASKETVIKGIYNFPAGYCGSFYKNEFKIFRWWNTLENLIEIPSDYGSQVEMLRELFLDSCRIRMRSDVSIGTALSGGVDSSAVIGGMRLASEGCDAKVNKDWRNTFVASLPGADTDETRYAEWASEYVGLKVNKVEINSYMSPEEMLDEVYICEVPYGCARPAIKTYKAMKQKGIKVTLDGHGSDELFAGYNVAVQAACGGVDCTSKEFEWLACTYKNMISVTNKGEAIDKDWLKSHASYLCQRSDKMFSGIVNNLDYLNKELYLEMHGSVLPTQIRGYDRYGMANGVEIRMPFLDYRIVCFAFSIPWTSKIRGGFSKAIVRDMARPFMDSRILDRKDKIGFSAPMSEWLNGSMKEFLLDTINSKDFRECRLINPLEVCKEVNGFIESASKDYYLAHHIYNKILPYLWEKAVIRS